jgi:hypothetical protein
VPDRRGRIASFPGDFFRRQSIEIGEFNHSALVRFESCENLFHQANHFLRRQAEQMARAVEHFDWRQFVQLIPAVKAVGFEMLSAVNAAVIGVLKEPSFEGSAVRIELICSFEDVQEDPLDGFFCFSIIAQDGAGNPED